MAKTLKYTGITGGLLVLLVAVIIVISTIHHQIQLSKEGELLVPPGQLVDVNGHQMHVYTEGNGNETLLFMAGGGTSAPVLDFKSLYTLLSDDYTIAVVEKAGYGFSDVTDEARDIDTILAETREALVQAGVPGPYIALPHSMSGIEAVYWAKKYPDDIKAIIGLDMAVPATYEDYDIPMPLVHAGAFAAKTGVLRWLPSLAESEQEALEHSTLTAKEKALYQVLAHRRTSTTNMVNEIKHIKANAKKAAETEMPDIPMLLFSSDGEETGLGASAWLTYQQDFVADRTNGEVIELDQSHHYLHNLEYERIATDAKTFIEGL